MTRILKSLIGRTRKETPAEDIEALDRATKVLQYRVQQMALKSAQTGASRQAA